MSKTVPVSQANSADPFRDDTPALPGPVFDRICKLVHDRAGIELHDGKEALVASRLGKKVRQAGCASYEEYLKGVEGDRTGESLIALIDALTTNYTSFLRESSHFDFLKKILPAIESRASIEIWCAAAATGEEPYTLAITMLEALGMGAQSRCRVVATDISTQALTAARRGVYPAERLKDIPQAWFSKYWLKGEGEYAGMCKVKPEVARMVEFRRLNLIEQFTHRGMYPVVFCRNVMIYFSKATQERVVARMASFLEPGGYLFVGHSESLTGIAHSLEAVGPAVYRKPRAGA
jgi:chemotaxis protein methyltransferase CheR